MKNLDRRLLIIILSTLFFYNVYCQDESTENNGTSKNTVYIEFLGSAGYLYNLSYDRVLISKGKRHFSAAVGFQYFPVTAITRDRLLSITPQLNYFYGIKHHIEFGVGAVFGFLYEGTAASFRIGYRYQKPSGGFFFKSGFTPLYTKAMSPVVGDLNIIPIVGIAAGWTF